MAKGGYVGKILRVDLSTGSITTEPLPDEGILRKYIGCYGLGLWYLMKELPMGYSALDPENPMIFMNGPLTGVKQLIPCPTNCTLTTLNGDNSFTAGRSHSHGWFGPYMKMAGYDGLIVTGASPKWVYLWIDDDKIELRDATYLLGKDTHETEDLVKEELGVPTKVGVPRSASVAAIGPAGENVVAGAIIENDKNHSFAHSGVGQIMGSKKLKAIAVRGTADVPIHDKESLHAVAKEWNKKAATEGVRGGFETIVAARQPGSKKGGAIPRGDYKDISGVVGLCVNNYMVGDLPGFGDNWSKHIITPRNCFRCPIGCCCDVEFTSGKHKGFIATLSGGGENIEGAAAIVGVGGTKPDGSNDPTEALFLADLHDRLGFETATVGCAIAVVIEAYEKGLITKEDTDGLELRWGDADLIAEILRRMAFREGHLAQILDEGPKGAALRVGLPLSSVDIKGSGMNLHDWRRTWGCLLGQIVGGGSGWHSPGIDCWGAEADAGYPQMSPPLTPFNKGEEVAATLSTKMWGDTNGTCWFATWGLTGMFDYSSRSIAALVGWDDFDAQEAHDVGRRIATLERVFNMWHGLTAEDDLGVSPRITEPAPPDAGPAAGKSVAPYVEGWVRDYYQALGWDRKTGKPWISTLKKYGLQEYAPLVWD